MARALTILRYGLSLAALGCGAIAVIEDDGGPGGAAGSRGECASVEACCDRACAYAASLPCWDGECECGKGRGDGCEEAWIDFLECALPKAEEAVVCHQGDLVLSCRVCEPERKRVRKACDRQVSCRDL